MPESLTHGEGPGTEGWNRLAVLKWTAATIIIILLTLHVWVPVTGFNTNCDAYVFGTAARRLLTGQLLYKDFFESKPPLMTMTYAVPGLILPGQEKNGTGMIVLLVMALFVQAAMWLYFLRPTFLAGLAAMLFLVIYPATYPDFAWASSEHLSNIFITLVLICSWFGHRDGALTSGRMFSMGAATCLAFHFRQNCLLVGIIPLAVAFTLRQPVRIKLSWFGWFVAGGLAAWAVILLAVCFISTPSEYFYQVFVFPRKFAAHQGDVGSRTESIAMQLSTACRLRLQYIFALGLGLALLRRTRAFVLFATVIGIGYCAVSPRPHSHYLINTFPFIMLLFFVGLGSQSVFWRIKEWLCVATLGVVLWFNSGLLDWRTSPRLEPMNEVVQAVNRIAGANDTLYVSGEYKCEYIQQHANPLPANKYAFAWEIDSNAGMMKDTADTIFAGYMKNPPTLLVFENTLLKRIGYPLDRAKTNAPNSGASLKLIYPTRQNTRPDFFQSVRLACELLTRHEYKTVWNNTNFYIFKLENNPTNQLPADAIPANVSQVR